MKKGSKILIALICIGIILVVFFVGNYNSLVSLNQKVNTAESNIDTQLQRRSDLIPNLVNTVKGYANQEKDIYTEIANARTKLAGANNISDQAAADSELSSALSRLLVIVENYPDLKSNQNFQDLSVQLEGTENRIAIARQDYNTAVTEFNIKRKRFPAVIVANLFGFQDRPLYKASAGASEVPSVDFSGQ